MIFLKFTKPGVAFESLLCPVYACESVHSWRQMRCLHTQGTQTELHECTHTATITVTENWSSISHSGMNSTKLWNCYIYHLAYSSLDHHHPIGSNLVDITLNVNGTLLLHPLQHDIQDNERSRPAHPSTAVHQQRRTRGRMLLTDKRNESGNACFVVWHPVVRPSCEVILGHSQGWAWVIPYLAIHKILTIHTKKSNMFNCKRHILWVPWWDGICVWQTKVTRFVSTASDPGHYPSTLYRFHPQASSKNISPIYMYSFIN